MIGLLEEIKETVFIAIGAILVASVLWFISSGIKLRNDFAHTRNSQIQTIDNAKEYREFNKYDGGECTGDCKNHISGWEVVAVIREYVYDEGIEIYVDKDDNGNAIKMNSILVRMNPDNYDTTYLQTILGATSKYHTMLIYDGADPEQVTSPQSKDYTSTVTGIRITRVD